MNPKTTGDSGNQVVRVVKRAAAIPQPDNFVVETADMPICPERGCLVEVLVATVDPAMRGWLSNEANYLNVADGHVMRALGVGRVLV